MKNISIIIPSRNLELLSRAVRSLVRTHKTINDFELIVIDDGLPEQPKFLDAISYVPGTKPFCFSKNINLGISRAHPENDIFIMNDDTFFISESGLVLLANTISQNEYLGVVTPVFARIERTLSQRLGYLEPDSGLWVESSQYLTFAAAYLRREMIEVIGHLDESFVGYGYEDNDYSLRAKLNNFQLGVLPSVVMGHGDADGRASLTFRKSSDFREKIKINKEIFIRKWGGSLLSLDEKQCTSLIRIIDLL